MQNHEWYFNEYTAVLGTLSLLMEPDAIKQNRILTKKWLFIGMTFKILELLECPCIYGQSVSGP